MKNQKPGGILRNVFSGLDPGWMWKTLLFAVMASYFALIVVVDALPYPPSLESAAITACELVTMLYASAASFVAILALMARTDARFANKLYLSEGAKEFANASNPAQYWIEGFIHALVFAALIANGHTNTAGFFLFASLGLLACAWLMTVETRKYVSRIPERA